LWQTECVSRWTSRLLLCLFLSVIFVRSNKTVVQLHLCSRFATPPFATEQTVTELIYCQPLGLQSARLTPVSVRQQLRREQSVPRTVILRHANY